MSSIASFFGEFFFWVRLLLKEEPQPYRSCHVKRANDIIYSLTYSLDTQDPVNMSHNPGGISSTTHQSNNHHAKTTTNQLKPPPQTSENIKRRTNQYTKPTPTKTKHNQPNIKPKPNQHQTRPNQHQTQPMTFYHFISLTWINSREDAPQIRLHHLRQGAAAAEDAAAQNGKSDGLHLLLLQGAGTVGEKVAAKTKKNNGKGTRAKHAKRCKVNMSEQANRHKTSKARLPKGASP